jgi:hypothetical protein
VTPLTAGSARVRTCPDDDSGRQVLQWTSGQNSNFTSTGPGRRFLLDGGPVLPRPVTKRKLREHGAGEAVPAGLRTGPPSPCDPAPLCASSLAGLREVCFAGPVLMSTLKSHMSTGEGRRSLLDSGPALPCPVTMAPFARAGPPACAKTVSAPFHIWLPKFSRVFAPHLEGRHADGCLRRRCAGRLLR